MVPEQPVEAMVAVEDAEAGVAPANPDAQDEEELAHYGYKQELRRDWGLMHNFGISFSIIVSPGCRGSLEILAFENLRWLRALSLASLRCLVMDSRRVDREIYFPPHNGNARS